MAGVKRMWTGLPMTVRHDGAQSAYDLSTLTQPCCTQEEGRPRAAALQEEAATHLTRRGSRARVVSGEATA
jgi:hypothetical protein